MPAAKIPATGQIVNSGRSIGSHSFLYLIPSPQIIHYPPYNIFISGDVFAPFLVEMQVVIDPARRREMQAWLDKTRQSLEHLWRPEPRAYVQRVRVLLNALIRTSVGTVLLTSLRRSIPLWIVPWESDVRQAVTGQMSSELTRGVKIRYSPDTWAIGIGKSARNYVGYSPIESLFHELVHASRLSNFGFAGMNKRPLENMQDHEEFLAVMMTNVLRSEWRAKKFQRDYMTNEYVNQSEMEEFLCSKQNYLEALEYFLTDPFVKQVARMPMAFNPFRDLSRLKTQRGSH